MTRCQRWTGGHPCDELMRDIIDTLGRVSQVCDACARFDAGLCRDCPRRRAGRSRRCDPCRARHKKSHDPIAYARRRDHYLAAKREKYRTDAAFRRRCIDDACRRQREAGRTDIIRAYEAHKAREHRARKRAAKQQRTAA